LPARFKTLIALLAVPALLIAPSAAGAAKTHTEVRPGLHIVSFDTSGSKGWKVSFNGSPDKLFKHQIGIEATKGNGESVSYTFRGAISRDGTIDAKLAGVARVAVHFETTDVKKLKLLVAGNCTAPKSSVTRRGVFRGTIELRGEAGYTTVHRTSAPGEIVEFPREVCKVKAGKESGTPAEAKDELEKLVHVTSLQVGRKQDGGTLSFTATNLGPAGKPAPPVATVDFMTTFTRFLPHHVAITARVEASGEPGQITVKKPNGTPSEATVEPPAPYKGSATFQLTSPTTANWSGDLRVDVPTLGKVMFTEPGFWSTLCENSSCTDTLPPGVEVGSFLFGGTSGFTGNFFGASASSSRN
jgi:hypothetical protein